MHINRRETNLCELVSLNISYKSFKFTLSAPSGTLPPGIIIKSFVNGFFPLR